MVKLVRRLNVKLTHAHSAGGQATTGEHLVHVHSEGGQATTGRRNPMEHRPIHHSVFIVNCLHSVTHSHPWADPGGGESRGFLPPFLAF